jgi:flagellar hook-length control protein FliK
LEITPFHVKQVNQTQQQHEEKNKLASSVSGNSFGHLFATYLSMGPNAELGSLSKQNAASIELKVEEQSGPVTKIPLPTDLIQTVEPNSPNLEEEQGFLVDEENQTGLVFWNLVPNQLVNQYSTSNVDGSNTASEKINLVSQEETNLLDVKMAKVDFEDESMQFGEEFTTKLYSNQAFVRNPSQPLTNQSSDNLTQLVIQSENEKVFVQPTITDSISKQNSASPEIQMGVLQTHMYQKLDTNFLSQQVNEIHSNQTVNQNLIEISQENMQPEDSNQSIQESTTLTRKDFPLFENAVVNKTQTDNPIEHIQNISYTTMSRALNPKDISNDSRKNEIPVEENKKLLLDKSQIIGHQPLPIQVNSSSKMSNMQSIPPSIHINDFVPELQKWMSNIKIINEHPGATEAKVSLFPKNLGHMEIKIMTVEGQLSAEIMTDTLLAKEILEGQLPQLKQSLQQSGLVVQKIEIFQQQINQLEDLNTGNLTFSHSGTNSSNEQRSNNSKQASSNKGKEIELTELGDEIPSAYGINRRNSISNIDFTA